MAYIRPSRSKAAIAARAAAKAGNTKQFTPPPNKVLINHVAFVIDASSSMAGHFRNMGEVLDGLIGGMKQNVVGQETRISLYTFASVVQRHVFDVPVHLFHKPNMRAYGNTSLIDGAWTAITELNQIRPVNKHEDHAYLLYVLTDGEENCSHFTSSELKSLISSLPSVWTVAIMVPGQTAVHYAKNVGFPAGNIEVWNINSDTGFEEASQRMSYSYAGYSSLRASGVTTTQSLFSANAANLTSNVVKSVLKETKGVIIQAQKDEIIREFVQTALSETYRIGSAYYELTKLEKVQAGKDIVIVEKGPGGRRYSGNDARSLLGLPQGAFKLKPGDLGNYRVFVQSTSVNRKIPAGASIFVISA